MLPTSPPQELVYCLGFEKNGFQHQLRDSVGAQDTLTDEGGGATCERCSRIDKCLLMERSVMYSSCCSFV